MRPYIGSEVILVLIQLNIVTKKKDRNALTRFYCFGENPKEKVRKELGWNLEKKWNDDARLWCFRDDSEEVLAPCREIDRCPIWVAPRGKLSESCNS